MTLRSISEIIPAIRTLEGAGFEVHRPFPRAGLDMVDPFLLLDELGPKNFAPGEALGAPDHPHRGFETVTYLLEGGVEHKDSVGTHGHIGPGGAQWMTAGSGVVHSEMPAEGIRKAGGRLHAVQLWINLPRTHKMTAPRYRDLTADDIPVVRRDGARIHVLAGDLDGVKGAVEPHSPIRYAHVNLEPGANLALPAPASHNAVIYVVGDSAPVSVGDRVVDSRQLAVFAHDGVEIEVRVDKNSNTAADLLVLCGEPLREPVVRYGPFVMNTRAEIRQAMDDFERGAMGRIGS